MVERDRRDIEEIEFDFFDEAPPRESSARESAPAPRRRRFPTPPPGGGAPLVRLGALIVGAILLAVVLVLWVNSCREGQKRGEYEDYMQSVAAVAGESEQIGRKLNQLISTPGKKLPDLRQELDGLRQQQSQTVTRAQALKPPGPLREQQESLVDALQLRVSGLNGLSRAFGQIGDKTGAQAAGTQLAEQSDRLVASDVVYEDFFKAGAQSVLRSENIQGVPVPDSNFVKNPDLSSPRSWTLIVQRLTQTPAAGGVHGNQIVSVVAQPGGKTLAPTSDNTVKASDRLAFHVLVKNSGEHQEARVRVNLTIQQSPEPIRKTEVIDIIDPGDVERVVFGDIGTPTFSTRTIVKVTVEPVVGETLTENNTAEYPVIFTL